ncbi:plasmid segregation oscillating ATPase ParF [Roseibium hamelinense]|uniref:Plasmid segregation oscillating ATPase ParF n=1 Tax=Roseibium hamelinense TaxID=150831 RepID=A0A562TG79_9HYPH|nr:ParA family partition ATPase [Roseibium hamelinense]MTI43082.1 ParA family protein [Roseibium hamelinense]TWI92571.1 plasmid segregation oscillating ATPase ParF [Roseibium hamelinense]
MAGHILTVAQQKGGSGKTTLAAHLAIALMSKADGPIAILDVDPQGSLGTWFETREEVLGEDKTGLAFRTASGWGARREARNLARDHAFVIIDTPPKTDTDAKPAIDAADHVIVPIQPTPVDLWATEQTFQLAAREDTPAILVLNRVPPRASLTQEMADAMNASGYPALSARLGNRTSFAASMGKGRTVMETDPSGKASKEMQALIDELVKHVNGST